MPHRLVRTLWKSNTCHYLHHSGLTTSPALADGEVADEAVVLPTQRVVDRADAAILVLLVSRFPCSFL